MLTFLLLGVAHAAIDPKCASTLNSEYLTKTPTPFDAVAQQDFLANYFALSLNNSAIHAPIPDASGHGHIGIQLFVIPPLSCDRRFVLYDGNYYNTDNSGNQVPVGLTGKTEDTNKSPIAPKLTAGFTMPSIGGFHFYGSIVYLPPVPVAGVRNVVIGGEFGVARKFGDHFSGGIRLNEQVMKTVGDVATAFKSGDPTITDLYVASTSGADLQLGYNVGPVRPYVTLGVTNVSAFFYVGDDGVISNDLHPYFGPEFAVGLDNTPTKTSRFRWGAEFYGAPGGHLSASPDPDAANAKQFARFGHLYTARLQAGIAI